MTVFRCKRLPDRRLCESLLLFLAFSLAVSTPSFSESNPTNGQNSTGQAHSVRYFFEIDKSDDFLPLPSAEKLELFRRIGRELHQKWVPWQQKKLTWVGLSAADVPLDKPTEARLLDDAQREAFSTFYEKYVSLLPHDQKAFSGSGLRFRGLVNFSGLGATLQPPPAFRDHAMLTSVPMSQLSKLQNSLNPWLEVTQHGVVGGFLDKHGLTLKVELMGGPDYASVFPASERQRALSIARFIEDDAMLSAAQLHINQAPDEISQQLARHPQTAIVCSYLASAGLNFRDDILANPAVESLLHLSLEPLGEGGLPDIRILARIQDPAKFVRIFPGLKTLAANIGVFVKHEESPHPFARLSFFLYPSLGIYVSLCGDLLLICSGPVPLQRAVSRIQLVSSNQAPDFPAPDHCRRYWRVHFHGFNQRLQQFLQSPLMRDKGIPPISNLTLVEDFDDLELITRMHPDRVTIDVNLPISSQAKVSRDGP